MQRNNSEKEEPNQRDNTTRFQELENHSKQNTAFA